ncbi:MAG: xanthine dehydrogenase family protein molybdopterin-binding subunit [Haloferacaceae archaeon]
MSQSGTGERVRSREADERTTVEEAGREVGRRRVRREDVPLITGQGEYVDDFADQETLHLSFHRSQYGHARIEDIDTSAAEAQEGVVAVFTYEDLAADGVDSGYRVEASYPGAKSTEHPLLVNEKVRYAGEAIAVVAAEDRYTAANAADLIQVDYERLDAVTDVESALAEDAPVVHPEHDDNCAYEWEYGDAAATDSAFDAADRTVEMDIDNQRVIPNAMEPRGAFAEYGADGEELTVRLSTQVPHRARGRLAEKLPLPEEHVRVIAPDVGGGFGSKGGAPYSEEPVTAWAALKLERPVKWICTRTESLQTDHHGRDVQARAELALDEDGTFRGLRVDAEFNLGAYIVWGSTPASNFRTLISGQYDIPAIHGTAVAALTNTAPIAPYRGAGRPESIFVVERIVEQAAAELGMDPVELRRRNQIDADAFPFETATGSIYDSGNYERALDTALEKLDYEATRERQRELREEGRYLGIGVCCFVENTGTGPGRPEWGRLELADDGRLLVHCGTSDHGQGHGTTYSQVLSDELGVPYDDIEVVEGDTADLPEGTGTFGSRSAPVGVSALVRAAERLREQAAELAGHHLEVPPADLTFEDGAFVAESDPDASIDIQELAALPHEGEGPRDAPELVATASYDPSNLAYAFGTHLAVVEVDPDSGEIEFERYVAVDDVGVQFNPRIVEGQVMGGVAQGIGQALYEGAVYDDNGTLASGSFQDYAMPKAMHIPDMEVDETETPCPHNPTGAKGAGEGGSIASTPAVVNAVVDALRPFGVENLEMPMTAETVWQAIQDAQGE